MSRLFRLPVHTKTGANQDVDQELEFHLQMRIDELKALGWTEEAARAEALRRFGNVGEARTALQERGERRVRRGRLGAWLADLVQDIGFAVRGLRRRPGFAAVAIGTIGLGLGLTTTVLAVVNRLVLHPLPYPDADRLTYIYLSSDETPIQISPSLQMLGVWNRSPGTRVWTEAYNYEQLLLETGETAELVQTKRVTPGLFRALGARIALGRGIQDADTAAAAPLVTVLAWTTWQRRFGGARDVLGTTVRINGKVASIVGVVGRGFDLTPLDNTARAEFWMPVGGSPGSMEESVSVIAQVRPGVPLAKVTEELRAGLNAAGLKSGFLERFGPKAVDPTTQTDHGRQRTLWLLTFAVGLVLAVACANVAALLLGQSAARAQEFGVRAALGAGRSRVLRQLITEATVLGGLGGATGLGVTVLALRLTRVTRPANLLALDDVALEPAVMLFALGVTLVVALLFGAAPAWAAARGDAAAAILGRIRRSLDTRFGRSLRGVLVVGQLAGSLVLLSGAGLFFRTFLKERNLPLGFDPNQLAWVQMDISSKDVPAAAVRDQIQREAAAAVAALPGVRSVALGSDPPVGFGILEGEFLIDGQPLPDKEAKSVIPVRSVAPDYFSALGMPFVAGHTLDGSLKSTDIVIDEQSAKKFFPRGNAVGSRIRYDRKASEYHTIVGVVPEQRAFSDFTEMPMVYAPPMEGERRTILIRTADRKALQMVSAAIRKSDPRIRIRSISTADEAMDERLAPRRFTMTIVTGFAGLALLLAAVGLYGVIALAVSQRTYEIGVRIALGAAPGAVRLMVLREGAVRVVIGLGLGFALVAVSGRILSSLLAEVKVWDPAVWAAAGVVLAGSGLLACWVPARRASRIDPMIALRSE